MSTTTQAFVEVQMLIRQPASLVYNAFIDPEITRHFWFTKGSDKLAEGKSVTWEWEMYNVSSPVQVLRLVPDRQIVIDWGEPATRVDFNFRPTAAGHTYVVIRQTGLEEQGDELLAQLRDLTGGFTTVVDGLKAWLEHGVELNLIADKFPTDTGAH